MIHPSGTSEILLTCDHAANNIPSELGDMGIDPKVLNSHMGLDIGALEVGRRLSAQLDACLIHSNYSRLVIDCNRVPGLEDSIPSLLYGTEIPGNQSLSPEERNLRVRDLFMPYHSAIEDHLQSRRNQGQEPVILAVHSFTPSLNGKPRPWNIGLSYYTESPFSRAFLKALREKTPYTVGEHEPYSLSRDHEYSLSVHGEKNCLQSVLLEIRQDQLIERTARDEITHHLERILRSISTRDS